MKYYLNWWITLAQRGELAELLPLPKRHPIIWKKEEKKGEKCKAKFFYVELKISNQFSKKFQLFFKNLASQKHKTLKLHF